MGHKTQKIEFLKKTWILWYVWTLGLVSTVALVTRVPSDLFGQFIEPKIGSLALGQGRNLNHRQISNILQEESCGRSLFLKNIWYLQVIQVSSLTCTDKIEDWNTKLSNIKGIYRWKRQQGESILFLLYNYLSLGSKDWSQVLHYEKFHNHQMYSPGITSLLTWRFTSHK